MKVAFITRSTLFDVPGGDTVQVVQTARHLEQLGITADIKLSKDEINYADYDLLHFFNLTRPADILYHSKKSGKPFVLSTILCNYTEYDKHHRKGVGVIFGFLPPNSIEYLKTIARWVLGKDHLASKEYLWKGQHRSITEVLKNAAMVLPNSESEYSRIIKTYPCKINHAVIPNGVDQHLFKRNLSVEKDPNVVLCVARIEGIKNQLNLIKALNNTRFKLVMIGSHAPNQKPYYDECRSIAASNITFINHIPQNELLTYYEQAKVHILPSWFETTGLSSIEGAVMGCNIVITDRGDAKEYFGTHAFYCNPGKPESIFAAVKKASESPYDENLYNLILKKYTWQQAATETLKAYKQIINYEELEDCYTGNEGYSQLLRGV
ncbi:MAG: glycosyltransferase family 4 protein [Bacteroidetes bacterium]|jgi:glycosyltransferase involved in cell wall biosynthesis|nr:glycosyltransferase family 4 protein [Bacteroidota bacterium]